MKIGNKTKIGIGVFLFGIILWQFGFFTRHNYLMAKIDIMRDLPRIASVGLPSYPCGVPCISLKEKYGFHELNIGCDVTGPQLRGIDSYNAQMEKYLNKINGNDWRKKYQAELDDMIKKNQTE